MVIGVVTVVVVVGIVEVMDDISCVFFPLNEITGTPIIVPGTICPTGVRMILLG